MYYIELMLNLYKKCKDYKINKDEFYDQGFQT